MLTSRSTWTQVALLSYIFLLVVPSNSCEKSLDHATGSEYLDFNKKILLKWLINEKDETIYFELTAETTGFVGFGISPNGGMTGADILIAGVKSDGSIYSKDCHGVGNTLPVEDAQSDWNVTAASETETHTTLRFHRRLNTCDKNDPIQITDATMRLIWALGETDDVSYHNGKRGTKSVNFYISDEDFEFDKYQVVDLLLDTDMPAQHTSYWCSIHKAPVFYDKQHVVVFDAILENEAAIKHTHHFMVYSCRAPADQDPETIFEPWVTHPGDHCYGPSNSSFPFSQYCHSYVIYVWSKGGKRLVFPSNLGLPIPDQLGRRDYYALETHYDNPDEISGLKFQTGGRMYYTSHLRETEVGIMLVDHTVSPQLTIPPETRDFVVSGHCSGPCTEKYFPEEGITIFNNLFHAHLAGRKLKLRHFRGNEELPWVDVDEYYDFDFQQNKPLTNPRKVLRGDQLTLECTFDSTSAKDGKAIVGGLGTPAEMCEAIFYYYPRQPWFFCESEQDMDQHFNFLGVSKYIKKQSGIAGGLPEYEILEPDYLAGDYRDSVSLNVNWTQDFREKYQKEKRYGEQIGLCSNGKETFRGMVVKYPKNLKEYVPPNECQGNSGIGNIFLSGFLKTLCIPVALIVNYYYLKAQSL